MNIYKKIRQYRQEAGLSQEQLAEKVLVSRQTISNWETNKSMPDVQSLVLLAETFDVSIDDLVTDKPEIIKKEKITAAQREFQIRAWIFALLVFLCAIFIWPLLQLFGYRGMIPWAVLFGLAVWQAVYLERQKKILKLDSFEKQEQYLYPDKKPSKVLADLMKTRSGKMALGIVLAVLAIAFWMLLKWILSF